MWVVFLLLDLLLSIVYYPIVWLLYQARWQRPPSIIASHRSIIASHSSSESEASELSETTALSISTRKTVVVVGASFAGLGCIKQLAYNSAVRVVLIDRRDYFEYTPGVLRLPCAPSLFRSMACPLPQGSHEFVQGTVTAVGSDHVMVACASGGPAQRIAFDYLVLATGADYRQPITAGEDGTTMEARQANWNAEAARLEAAASVLVLGGGAVGAELAAEVKDHFPEKHVTLLNSRSHLVPLFPARSIQYVEEWCQSQGIEVLLNRRVRESDDASATLENGEVLKADVVYSCLGMRPNSKFLEAGDLSGCLESRRQVKVNAHLQLEENPHVFAMGDMMTNPSGEIKQAFYADLNGELVGKNVLLHLEGEPLLKFPDDIVGAEVAPLVYVISCGRWSASLGFNTLVLNGVLPAVLKWVLEWLKLRQVEGRPIGLLGYGVAEPLTNFLSRTIIKPAKPQQENVEKHM